MTSLRSGASLGALRVAQGSFGCSCCMTAVCQTPYATLYRTRRLMTAMDAGKGLKPLVGRSPVMLFPAGSDKHTLAGDGIPCFPGHPAKVALPHGSRHLATGLAAGKSDPAYVLRERLMRGVEQAVGTRESMLARFCHHDFVLERVRC